MPFDPIKSLIPYIEDREGAPDSEGFLAEGARQPTDIVFATLLKSGVFGDYVFGPNVPGAADEVIGRVWLKPGATILDDGEVKVWNGSIWQAGISPWSVAGGAGGLSNLLGVITLEAHGAEGDARRLTDCTISAGTAIVSSASYDFTSDDIGKAFALPYGVDPGVEPAAPTLVGTIAGLSGTDAVLSTNATETVTGGEFVFGTDDSAAWLAAVAAADSAALANGSGRGGEIRFAPGRGYWLASQAVASYEFDIDLTGADVFMHGLPVASNLIQNGENTFLIKWTGLTHANAIFTGVAPQVLGAHPDQTAKTTLTADLVKGEVIASVASTAGMKRGDYVVIMSEHDIAWDTGGGFLYHYIAQNRVEEVVDGLTVRLKYPLRARAFTIAGGTVSMMTVDLPRRRCVIRGGESGTVWGDRYNADMKNGQGQHFALFNGIGVAVLDGVNFEGVTGYPAASLFCDRLEVFDCTTDGRDASEVPYVEDESSFYGFVMSHFTNVQISRRCKGRRVRHLCDGAYTGIVAAQDCYVNSAGTSAYRTHRSCEVMILDNCEIEGGGGVATEAEINILRQPDFRGLRGTGFFTVAANYPAAPSMSFLIERPRMRSADTIDPEDGNTQASNLIAIGADIDACRIIDPDLKITGGAVAGGGNPFTTTAIEIGGNVARGDSARNLEISGGLIDLKGCPAGVRGINIANGRVFGSIHGVSFDGETTEDFIRIQEPSAADAGRLQTYGNRHVGEGAIAATELITWVEDGSNPGDYWGENFPAWDNYSLGPAFPKTGTLSDFKPYFDKNLGEELATSFASAQYIVEGHILYIRFSALITDKQGHTGNLTLGPFPFLGPASGHRILSSSVEITGVAAAKSFDYSRNLKARISPTASETDEFLEFYSYSDTGGFEFVNDSYIDNAVDFSVFGTMAIMLDNRVRPVAA